MQHTHAKLAAHARSLVGAIRTEMATGRRWRLGTGEPRPSTPAPFVTISRQAGAGGLALAAVLADRLNALGVPTGNAPAWAVWDHELVEKVSAEHDIAAALVDALEESRHGWVQDFLSNLSPAHDGGRHPDEFKVYRRLAHTIRGLARAGGAILVGRGGVFVTRGLPAGVHVRLVAPLDARVAATARRLGLSAARAARRVREIDANRESFYRRYWPGKSLGPESFTVTLNTAGLAEDQMAACVLPLVRGAAERLATPGPPVDTTAAPRRDVPHAVRGG